jgi:Amt family ammonium transporter
VVCANSSRFVVFFSSTGVHTYDLGATMNGCLTGLVGITAGAATVEPWAAVVIGLCSGWIYLLGSWLCIRFKIDDCVDAIPVHLGGGAWGVLSTGLFTSPQRLLAFYGNDTYVGWFYEWVSAVTLVVCGIVCRGVDELCANDK